MFRLFLFLTTVLAGMLLLSRQPMVSADSITAATPQLLDAAFERGEISAGERILYLAYAIYEDASLPARFQSDIGWHGTMAVREIHEAYAQDRAGYSRTVGSELDRLMNNPAATICDRPDGPNDTTTEHFFINYGTIGGGLTLDKYKVSLEAAFDKIVTEYGWAQPPVCTAADVTEGGCDYENDLGGSGLYPVQVVNIGSSVFGYVASNYGDGDYVGVVGDNPHTSETETASRATCMVLNSDMSQLSLPPQQGLDSTTSHEYVHAVQYAYGTPYEPEPDNLWFESIAGYFEDEMDDASNTANIYLWPKTTNCLGDWENQGDPDGVSEYSAFLFFRHIAENTGGANMADGGENTIQAIWKNIGQGQLPFAALNNALQAATPSTNLNDAYHDYAIAVYNSKSCTGDYAPYCFTEGAEYIAGSENPLPPVQGWIDTIGSSYSGDVNEHYATNYVDLPSTGSYLVNLKNDATTGIGQLRGSVVCDTGAGYNVTPLPSVVGPNQSTEVNINASSCTEGVFLTITNQGTTPGVEPPTGSCTVPAPGRAATNYTISTGTVTAVTLQQENVTSSPSWMMVTAVLLVLLSSAALLTRRTR